MNDFFDRFLKCFEEYQTARQVSSLCYRYGAREAADTADMEVERKADKLKEAFIDAVKHYAKQ